MIDSSFPLSGVIGIIANSRDEIAQATQRNLQCVEMRPDLLLHQGFSLEEVMSIVEEVVTAGLRCLFTMRRHDHGGKFTGSDKDQMDLCLQAIAAGAHIVDVEWDSECAAQLIAQGVPTILSQHDFNATPSDEELASVTDHITAMNPAAIKLVPTANCFEDSVRILRWVDQAKEGMPRIGFAMGGIGEYSRILARRFGSPITYATFGAPVAPGQIDIDHLLHRYHAQSIDRKVRIVGVVESEKWLEKLNGPGETDNARSVAVPIVFEDVDEVKKNAEFLGMDSILLPKKYVESISGLTEIQEVEEGRAWFDL